MTTTTRQPLLSKTVCAIFAILFFTLLSNNVNAATRTWSGANSTSWTSTGNWSGAVVPVAGDLVLIPGSVSRYPVISTSVTVSTITINNTNSNATLTIIAGGNLSVTSTLTINGTGALIQTGGTITAKDFRLVASNSSFTQNENSGTSLLNITRDYYNNGGNFTSTAGTTNWTGAFTKSSPRFNSGTNQFYHVTINGSNNVGFANAATGLISVAGNWTNNNSATDLISAATTVTFNGTVSQTISGTQTTNFYNLTINKASNSITLNTSASVSNTLTLTSGIVNTTLSNLLNLTSTATTTGASASSYINGPVKKTNLTSAFVFPVGTNNKLRTATISAASVSTDAFLVEYTYGMPNDTSAKPSGVNTISSREFWTITRTGTGTATVVLTWNDSSKVTTPANLRMVSWNGTSWTNLSGTASGTTASGTLTVTGVSSFNNFTFGSTTAINPLPVKLISFLGKLNNNNTQLNWATATELNNDHFEIERSIDGVNYTKIGEVTGNGTTKNLSKYNYIDNQITEIAAATVYYRLKQIDFNGNFEYSNIITVSISSENSLKISNAFPNPFQGSLNISFTLPSNSDVTISLVDAKGQVVATEEIKGRKGNNNFEFNTSELANGMYFINISANNLNAKYKMMAKQ